MTRAKAQLSLFTDSTITPALQAALELISQSLGQLDAAATLQLSEQLNDLAYLANERHETLQDKAEWDALDWDALAASSAARIAREKAAGTYKENPVTYPDDIAAALAADAPAEAPAVRRRRRAKVA